MNRMFDHTRICKTKREAGATLLELMIAMLILAVGLGALTSLVVTSMATDNRNSRDTTATLLAQKIIEEVTAQNANAAGTINLTDCAGNVWTIPATQGLPAPAGQGANLVVNAASPFYGGIDFTQALGAVPAGFAMQWVDCDPNGQRVTYDVRWNIMTVTANSTRMITASARRIVPDAQGAGGNLYFAIPVTLRSIGGS